jgi:hypothetical protein
LIGLRGEQRTEAEGTFLMFEILDLKSALRWILWLASLLSLALEGERTKV